MLIPEEGVEFEEYDWDEIVNDEIDINDKSVWQNKDKDIVQIVHQIIQTGSKYMFICKV